MENTVDTTNEPSHGNSENGESPERLSDRVKMESEERVEVRPGGKSKSKTGLAIGLGIGMVAMLVAGAAGGYLFGLANLKSQKCPACPEVGVTTCPLVEVPVGCGTNETPVTESTTGKSFYHRIVAFGKDAQGKNVMVKLQLTRNQKDKDNYDHSYMAYLIQGDSNSSDWRSFVDASNSIVSGGFITAVDYYKAPDGSPRERYKFTLNIKGKEIVLELDDLNGDFISKASLDNTRFVSTGTAKITIDGKAINGNAMVDQIYSYNDGSNANPSETDLKYVTHSLMLWDQDNNFYLIDTTDVNKVNPSYNTHRWILYKDRAGKTTMKAFDANLTYNSVKWHIVIPELSNTTMDLTAVYDFAANKGIVEGKVTKLGTTKNISGHYVYVNAQ